MFYIHSQLLLPNLLLAGRNGHANEALFRSCASAPRIAQKPAPDIKSLSNVIAFRRRRFWTCGEEIRSAEQAQRAHCCWIRDSCTQLSLRIAAIIVCERVQRHFDSRFATHTYFVPASSFCMRVCVRERKTQSESAWDKMQDSNLLATQTHAVLLIPTFFAKGHAGTTPNLSATDYTCGINYLVSPHLNFALFFSCNLSSCDGTD